MAQLVRNKRGTYTGVIIIIAAAVLLEVIAAIQYNYFHAEMEDELEEKAEAELTMKAIVTKNILSNMEKTLAGHIWDMKREIQYPDSMFNISRWIVKSNPAVLGCGIAFRPYYYPQKGRLFEPYAQRIDGKIIMRQLANSNHDYTKEGSYSIALKAHRIEGNKIGVKQGLWLEPYYDHVTSKNTITYTLPIWDRDSSFVGVFGMDLSLDLLGDTLNRRHIYPSSYDLLLSEKGKLLASPILTDQNRQKIENIVHIINDSTIAKKKSHRGRSTVARFKDPDGRKGIVFFAFFKGVPHWQVAVVCYDDEVFSELSRIRTKTMLFSLLGLLVLGLILYLAMRNILRLQKATVEQERINSELHIASTIQKEMLPVKGNDNINRDDLDIACSLVPAKEVGGDLYDYFIRDDKLFFCIGDVSGKGVPSAIVMAVIHSLFRMASAHENNPAHIMQTINEVACHNNRSNMFVTMFVGVLDLPTGVLRYCNAGHDAPIILGRGSLKAVANLPVGVFDDFEYHMQQSKLSPGEIIFLYTDGLTEAKDRHHHQFGLDRVKEVLNHCADLSPQPLLTTMSTTVNNFMRGTSQSDDLTMIAICYNPVQPSGIH